MNILTLIYMIFQGDDELVDIKPFVAVTKKHPSSLTDTQVVACDA